MNTKRFVTISVIALIGAATGFAQTTTTPTPPSGVPAGSSSTGTTNSGGVAPAPGKPGETPTGPTAGGTGSGTTAPTPTTGRPETTPTRPTPTMGAGSTTATGGGVANAPTNPGNHNRPTLNENASDNAKAVQAVLKQFDAKRDAIAMERKALIEKLSAAKTDAERKPILEQLRTEQKSHADEQRALGKEIREELKKVRDQRKTGGS